MIKKYLYIIIKVYLLSSLIISFLGLLLSCNSTYLGWHIMTALLYYAPINTLFVTILFVCRINISNFIKLLIEICLLLSISFIINYLIDMYVGNNRFELTNIVSEEGRVIAKNVKSIKWQYSVEAQLCYSYILLSMIYLVIYFKKLRKK